MNRAISIFACCLGVASFALLPAQIVPHRRKAFRSSSPVSTLKDSNTAASNGSTPIGQQSPSKYQGGGFVAGSTYTCTQVDVYLTKVGSPTFNLTLEIRDNNSGDPGTLVGTGSSTVLDSSTVTGSETAYSFTGLNASITSGNTYWIVLTASSIGDASNHILVYRNSVSANLIDTSGDGTTWAQASNTRRSKFATYGY